MLNFAYNPTSWDDGPIPGGMADCLIRPILPHLDVDYELTGCPHPDAVNVFYTFPHTYGISRNMHGTTSVFVSHGIADKAWRNTRKIRPFDYVFVSGPEWSHRLVLEGYPHDRIIEAGYCKLDPIFQGQVESPWTSSRRVKVLYAPTHGGGGEKYRHATTAPPGRAARSSSYWDRDRIVSLLPEDRFDVKVAVHPRHRPDAKATLAEYVGADVVIADGGSTIYEAWALGLPVVFPSWLTREGVLARSRPSEPTLEGRIYTDRLGYHAESACDLPDTIAAAVHAGIRTVDRAFIERVLPQAYRGESGRMHAEALSDICAGRPVRHTARIDMVVFEHLPSGRTKNVPAHGAARYDRSDRWRRVEEVNA